MITIELENYNLQQAELEIVNKLIADKPSMTYEQYAKELGIAWRTLIRWKKLYNIQGLSSQRGRRIDVEKMIEKLTSMGYEITKTNEK